jgi:hypothetical protein
MAAQLEWFKGNFAAYEEDKTRRLGADSLIPKRIKFQKFGRSGRGWFRPFRR